MPHALRVILMFAFLSATSSAAVAATVVVSVREVDEHWLRIYSSTNDLNRLKPEKKWLPDGRLLITALRQEIGTTYISKDRPLVKRSGNLLMVCYHTAEVKVPQGAPVTGGVTPVLVDATVEGVPRRKYAVNVKECP